jgi:hypothetical protein
MSSKSKPSIKGSVIANKYNSNEKSISQHMRRTNDLCIKSRMNLHKLDPHDIISHSPRSLKFFRHYISTEPLNLRHFGKPEIDVEEMPIRKLGSISSTFKSLPISKPTSILEQAGSIKSGQLIVQRKTRNLPTMIDDAEIAYQVAVYNRFKSEKNTVEALNRHISQLTYIKNMIEKNRIISNACCSSLSCYLSKFFRGPSPLDQLENEVDTELKMVSAQLDEAKYSAPNDARMHSLQQTPFQQSWAENCDRRLGTSGMMYNDMCSSMMDLQPESDRRMQDIGAPRYRHLVQEPLQQMPSTGTGILEGSREDKKMFNPSQPHRMDFAGAVFSSELNQAEVIQETKKTMDGLIALDHQFQGFDSRRPGDLVGIINILKDAYVLTRDYRSKILELFHGSHPDPVFPQEELECFTKAFLKNDGIKDAKVQFTEQIKKFEKCLGGSFTLEYFIEDIYNFVKMLYLYSLDLNSFKES